MGPFLRLLAALAALLALSAAIGVLTWWVTQPAGADEAHMAEYHGTPERDQWMRSLKTPYGGSCCDLNDCRETEAEWRQGDDGEWRWYASVDSYRGKIVVAIPADRVLDEPKSFDGEAYVCHTPGSAGGTTYSPYTSGAQEIPASDPHIYCFIPPLTSY